MQTSLEVLDELERRLTIHLPQQLLDEAVSKQLQARARQQKMDGFRPGKAPLQLVEKLYGPSIQAEVTEELMEKSFFEAIKQENIRPASYPRLEPALSPNSGSFSYTATFEVYPEITLNEAQLIAIEKPVATIQDDDVTRVIENLRKQSASWHTVARDAREGDRLLIKVASLSEPVADDPEAMKQEHIVLEQEKTPAHVYNGLIGKHAGNDVEITYTYPADHPNEGRRGSQETFKVHVVQVEEASLPDLDEAFIKTLGVEANEGEHLSSLRQQIQENLDGLQAQQARSVIKEQLMAELLKHNPISVPKALVADEMQQLRHRFAHQLGIRLDHEHNHDHDHEHCNDPSHHHALPASLFEEQAKRRVALGLLLAAAVEKYQLKVEPKQLHAHIERIALNSEEPQKVIEVFQKDRNRLAEVELLLLEEQLIDHLLPLAKVTEKPMSFEEIMRKKEATTA